MHSLFPDQLLLKAEEEVSSNEERHSTGAYRRSPIAITSMLLLLSHLTNQTRSPVCQHGSKSQTDNRARKVMAKPQLTSRNWLRVQISINANYCINCVAGQEDCVHVSGKMDSLSLGYTPPPSGSGQI